MASRSTRGRSTARRTTSGQPRAIGDLVLDTAFTDVDARRGRAVAGADGCSDGAAATLWGDEAYPWIQLFTGDTLPAGQARAGLAVEPMTCGPDAFNTGDGVIVLEPGETAPRARWGITPASQRRSGRTAPRRPVSRAR